MRHACPGPGACGGMYTANTMASAIEALGMSLPYSASTPAEDPLKKLECRKAALCAPAPRSTLAGLRACLIDISGVTQRLLGGVHALCRLQTFALFMYLCCRTSGGRTCFCAWVLLRVRHGCGKDACAKSGSVCHVPCSTVLELLKANIRPRDIMTRPAFENAMVLVMALGGSTNAVLHLLAMAHAAGVKLSLDDFQVIGIGVWHAGACAASAACPSRGTKSAVGSKESGAASA